MPERKSARSEHLELSIAIFIAVVSITSALAAWRISAVASNASNLVRQGMIDAVKQGAGVNENIRQLYDEAGYGRDYAIYLAGIKAMEASGDPNAALVAQNARDYVLPILLAPAAPLATDPKYQKPDGTYDLAARLEDLNSENRDVTGLDPQASFAQASRMSGERRLLIIGAVIMVLSLLWLGLAQVSKGQLQRLYLWIGAAIYLVGLLWFVGIEMSFVILS